MSRLPATAAEALLRYEPSASWGASMSSRLDDDWYPGEWTASSWTFVGDPDNARTWVFRCTIPGCPGYGEQQGLYCRRCRRNWIMLGHPEDFAQTFQPNRLMPDPEKSRRFCLAELPDQLRTELLFALQVYSRDRAIMPGRIARLADYVPRDTTSLLGLTGELVGLPLNERGLLRVLRGILNKDFTTFEGVDPTRGDVWDCGLVGLQAATFRDYTAQVGTILDFRPIHQRWLRELAKEYVRANRLKVHRARPVVRACAFASRALLARPDGDRPERLGIADMTAVVELFQGSLTSRVGCCPVRTAAGSTSSSSRSSTSGDGQA